MMSTLAEAWRRNNEKNLFLLDAVPAKALAARYSDRTRTVASQFAHMHNVRVYHLQRLRAKHLGKLETFPRGAQPAKKELRATLKASENAIANLLSDSEAEGRVKGWNGTPTMYLSYFVSHESHHRGLVLVSLRLSGVKLSKDVVYGLWYWRKKRAKK
jgi:uncharacterized damage-inducible protein DinB